MYLIEKNGTKLAAKIVFKDIGPGLSFFSDDVDFIQVGGWRYEKGKKLLAHSHYIFDRKTHRTQEFVFVVRGAVKASVYGEDDDLVKEVILGTDEGLIMFAGGHGYEILENDTLVLEVKNGPYAGAQLDRRRL